MSLTAKLDQIENKFFGELEEDREAIMPELGIIHKEYLANGLEEFRKFEKEVVNRFGGAYIPYVFWVELANFLENNEDRKPLFDILEAFSNSSFEEEERKKLKGLLIVYYSIEKEFEVDKIDSLIVEKAHPDVQEYFRKLKGFIEKNSTSVEMYVEKFSMLNSGYPDFTLFRMPVIKLKEKLASLG